MKKPTLTDYDVFNNHLHIIHLKEKMDRQFSSKESRWTEKLKTNEGLQSAYEEGMLYKVARDMCTKISGEKFYSRMVQNNKFT